jgi:hypothetical protein
MPRGCAPGERRGGRQKGTPNKATADIKALAQDYGPAAIAELARMSGLTGEPGAQTEAARVACLKELLDRGYGRATQPLTGDGDGSPVHYTFEWAPASPRPQDDAAPTIEGQPNIESERRLELVWSDDQ